MTCLFFDAALFADLMIEARGAARRRSHRLLHHSPQEAVQRMLIAIEPDSYVRPHCHFERAETLLILQGRLGVLRFAADGQVIETRELAPGGPGFGCELAPGGFHAIVALAPATLLLEVKAGPYVPLVAGEWAEWAPPEGAEGAAEYLEGMRACCALAGLTAA